MRLSKRAEYGLRAVVQLAKLEPQKYVQTHELSTGQEKLPNKFLESVLLALRRGGFLESKVGSKGGYRLSRHPREVSVGDLIRRLEGRLTVAEEATSGRIVSFRKSDQKGDAGCDLNRRDDVTHAADCFNCKIPGHRDERSANRVFANVVDV